MSYNSSYNTPSSSARRPSRSSTYATTPRTSSRDIYNPSLLTSFRTSSGVGSVNPGTSHVPSYTTTTIPIQSVSSNGNSTNGFSQHSHNNNNHSHR